jgi:hypothetical protein
MLLVLRRVLGLSVDGPTGGGEENPTQSLTDPCLHKVEESTHVHVRVEAGVLDRLPYVHLRGVVDQAIVLVLSKERRSRFRTDVMLEKRSPFRSLPTTACGEVIEDVNLVPFGEKCISDVRADESSTACYKNGHAAWGT